MGAVLYPILCAGANHYGPTESAALADTRGSGAIEAVHVLVHRRVYKQIHGYLTYINTDVGMHMDIHIDICLDTCRGIRVDKYKHFHKQVKFTDMSMFLYMNGHVHKHVLGTYVQTCIDTT